MKHLHIGCVALSGAGFALRGLRRLRATPAAPPTWARIAPHALDTLLLASALGLALTSGQYPFVDTWLSAKLLGLIAYVAFGAVALKYGRTRRIRATAFAAALLAFTYIVGVALTKSAHLHVA